MNKPANKEPSMDEILSSIRQIIADEDTPETAAAAPEEATPAAFEADPVEEQADAAMMAEEPASAEDIAEIAEEEPFSLSADQMVAETSAEEDSSELDGIDFSPASAGMEGSVPPSTLPEVEEDVAPIETDVAEEPEVQELASTEPDELADLPDLDIVIADDISFDDVDEEPEVEVEAEPSAMPDPELSTDIVEKLIEPTTAAAVSHTFAKLGALSAIGGDDLTLDSIVREMLRPMLKEWLDENLPATVERMVEKEIERVSRGG